MTNFLRFSARTVALSYVAVSLLVLTAFATPLWYSWRETIEEERAHILNGNLHRLIEIHDEQGLAALKTTIDVQVGSKSVDTEDLILLADAQHTRITGNIPTWPAALLTTPGMRVLSIDINGRQTRIAAMHASLPDGYQLLVANNIDKYQRLEHFFLLGLSIATSIVVLLGIISGIVVRRTLLSKVKDINQAASAIMAGDVSHRLPHESGESELNTLVATQNRMLDQIEQLISSVRNVSNAIAHDLRTPLTELRSRLEELSLTPVESAFMLDEIHGAIADVDRVISIFNALLRLAEIDTGARRSGFVELDAAKVAFDVTDFYLPLAEAQGCSLTFISAGPLLLSGDPILLAQSIGNLIDNAIKFTGQNGAITVETLLDSDGARLISVADNGPGISDAEKKKVLDRFYRSDTSRGTPGVGLGLSLVAAVAKLHGATLTLSDMHPGLKVSLRIDL